MAHLSQTTVGEEYESDFDDSPDEDVDEQITPKEPNDDEQQRNQIFVCELDFKRKEIFCLISI